MRLFISVSSERLLEMFDPSTYQIGYYKKRDQLIDNCLNDVVSKNDNVSSEQSALSLTDAQRARVERNRQRALLLRQSRLTSRPYTTDRTSRRKQDKVGKKPVDTGGGFLIEEDEDGEMEQKIVHPPGSQFEV
ncbi:hypothetical protein LSAT2_021271 [Lamellibrachia satsuma]|nr:hypothetical protein LSAT2_021271 [Lamellibrachia satsuma]